MNEETTTELLSSPLDTFVGEKNAFECSEAPEYWESMCDDDGGDDDAERDEQTIYVESS